MLLDWAENLKRTRWEQLFKICDAAHAFANATIEDVSVIMNLIGVVEHAYPKLNPMGARRRTHRGGGPAGGSARPEKRTYFIDPYRKLHNLDRRGSPSPDGKDRVLRSIGRA